MTPKPQAPAWLSESSREQFDVTVTALPHVGVQLTPMILADLAHAWAVWDEGQRLREMSDRAGNTREGSRLLIKSLRLVAQSAKFFDAARCSPLGRLGLIKAQKKAARAAVAAEKSAGILAWPVDGRRRPQ